MSIRLCLILLLLFPLQLFASSIGITPERVWLSKATFFEGETIEIATVVVNNSDKQLTGSVEFLDGSTVLGQRPISVRAGKSEIISLEWKATYGNKLFSARIVNPVLGESSFPLGGSQSSGKVSQFVDIDTDGDLVGNKVDTDDDNDGLSDADELKRNTNPLMKDTDGDGAIDSMDARPLVSDAPATNTQKLAASGSATSSARALDLSVLPDSIEPEVEDTANVVEQFRVDSRAKVDSTVTGLIEKAKGTTTVVTTPGETGNVGWSTMVESVETGDLLKTPFTYVKLFLSLCVQLVLTHAWLFYGIIIGFIIFLFRFIRSLIFGY